MSLQAPLFLLLLLVIPVAGYLYWRREQRTRVGEAAFAVPKMLPAVAPQAPAWRRHAPLIAYAVALAALCVALARPQVATSVPVEQARIILVTDQSGSMAADDVIPTRLAAAISAQKDFIEKVPKAVQIAAITYNKIPRVIQGPTTDRESLIDAIESIQVKGRTATGEALKVALRQAQATPVGTRPPPAAIVLLSDGKSVVGADPVEVAQEIGDADIPIYTIALGTPDGEVNGNKVPPDVSTMEEIAEVSGGESFAVTEKDRLEGIYQKLGSQLTRKQAHKQVTAGFAGGGLALILVGAGMSLWWFGRVP